ncbi:MAG: phenylacetic acid catabolic, partial [Nitriliruptorales bacterium]
PDGRRLLQELVDGLLPEMLCWFGPPGEEGVDALIAEGLLSQDNENMRATYLDRVAPLREEVGIEHGIGRADDGWEVGELPWGRWNRLQRRLEP